jgi:hypothetical protein
VVVNELYYGQQEASVRRGSAAPVVAEASGVSIDDDIIAAALRNIYRRDFNPHTDIEPNLFNAIAHSLGEAVSVGSGSAAPALGDDPFLHALRHSTDVFSAFKTHRAQNDMAARLLDSNGNLKPFEQWKNEVLPIADHQCHNWLETEYNTAVLRARQAANWQQFQAEKDVLPNLKWLPSTSPNPGEDHRPFWNTILPIDHPFWDQHRPGDRWNCKCDLTSTDEQPTRVPAGSASGNNPQPGLTDNPGKTQAVFSEDHPYFPSECNRCPFYNPTIQARLAIIFRAQTKDCYHCPYIDGCINEVGEQQKKQLQERQNEYHRLLNDPNYKNVQFDEKTGGIKATHVGHSILDDNNAQTFFDGMKPAELEMECQDLLYRWGHKAILRDEYANIRIARRPPSLDLELDGVIMDIRSITQEGMYGGALTAKNHQLGNVKKKTGLVADSVCLHFHDASVFSEERLIKDMNWYKEYIVKVGSKQRIKHVYVVVNGESRLRIYDI